MSFLIGFLYVVEVIVCLLLALAVMLQKPKEGGLGGAIGGGMGEAVFGADASNVLIKVTIWLGAIFLANTLLLARLTSTRHSQSVVDLSATTEQQQPAQPQTAEPAAELPPLEAPAKAPAANTPPPPAPAPAAKPAPAPAPSAKMLFRSMVIPLLLVEVMAYAIASESAEILLSDMIAFSKLSVAIPYAEALESE